MEYPRTIDSPETLIAAIHRFGLLPFFKNGVRGWSVEEMTAPGCWWDTEGVLGPWDWKIEAVRSGIAYGKFLGSKAAFATEEYYRDLMNWRRSIPKYAPAPGLQERAISVIREQGAARSKDLRVSCADGTPLKKSAIDNALMHLQMGTWTIVGEFERVYRGPSLEYSGWQLSINTSPEGFFGTAEEEIDEASDAKQPAWARRFAEATEKHAAKRKLTPEESREKLITHVSELFPEADESVIRKMI